MKSFTELSGGDSAKFLVRWRGRQEGPYPASTIEAKLASNEIGLLHEIFHNGQWVTIRDYVNEIEAVLRAERLAREEQERRVREEAERQARELTEKQRNQAEAKDQISNEFSKEDSHRRALLESAVLAVLRPKYPKWPWILLGVCLFCWYSCSEWQSSLVAQAQQYLQVSKQMESPDYQFGKGVEAFVRGFEGDPFGVAQEEFEKEETIKSELRQIDSDYQTAWSTASFCFLGALVMLSVGIWKHRSYKRTQTLKTTSII